MDVSVKGEYALRAVFDLAGRGGSDPVKIAEIAARQRFLKRGIRLGSRMAGVPVKGGIFANSVTLRICRICSSRRCVDFDGTGV